MPKRMALVVFLVLTVGGGLAIGYVTAPDEWYADLVKPAFNPPNWIFAPVWTVLYVLIGMAGWRVWLRDRSGWPMKLWWAQLGLNFLWSPVFFLARRIDLALGVVVLLLLAILAFVIISSRSDRIKPKVDKDGNPVLNRKGRRQIAAKYTGMHALRHFFASWCINRVADGGLGLPPKLVQQRMGHSTLAMTMDTYGHLFPSSDDGGALAEAERRLIGLHVAQM